MQTASSLSAFAEPTIEWSKTYGGDKDDMAWWVQQTTDGGYVLTGYTASYGAGDLDFWLIKTDRNGNLEWDKTFGGAAGDIAYSVRETADRGYIIVGITYSFGAGGSDIWLVKTDRKGNLLWSRTFGGPSDESVRCVQQTLDGGYIIAGYTSEGVNKYTWLIKTDRYGIMQWNRLFGPNSDEPWACQQTIDGGYIIVGSLDNYHQGWLIKTDRKGNLVWDKKFSESDCNTPSRVRQTFDGGYILGGCTCSDKYNDKHSPDYWLVKTDWRGNIQWSSILGGAGCEGVSAIDQIPGGYITSGVTSSFGNGGIDGWLVIVDNRGNMVWSKAFGGSGDDWVFRGQMTLDGGYITAGTTNSFGNGGSDVWLVKIKFNLRDKNTFLSDPSYFVGFSNVPRRISTYIG